MYLHILAFVFFALDTLSLTFIVLVSSIKEKMKIEACAAISLNQILT